MATVFDTYNEEFTTVSADISKTISDVTNYESDQSKKMELLRNVDVMLVSASDLVKQMEIEVRSQSDAATKRDLQNKVGNFKKALNSLQGDYRRAREAEERRGLLGDVGEGLSADQRQRLLKANDLLDDQNDRLGNARRVIQETEDVALEITEELGRNREKIQSAHSKVKDVGALTNTARRIVHSMNRREVQQRLMMYGLALILLGAIAVVVYYCVW
mmetsp:Transcript_30147/g.39711  ORF Transcript_30147/g.39711 Transcript_30147/m.39711 type:complete len:217 (-) Transcript_30147:154-804(-)